VEATVGDTIFLPGFSSRLLRAYPDRQEWEGVYGWLQEKADAGVRICSVCTGAFILARAGLLDGRACTTHWSTVPLPRQLFPAIDVREDILYIQDGNIYTSAGVSSGIDLALHLLEVAHGPLLAHKVARELVVYIRHGDRHSTTPRCCGLNWRERFEIPRE
jgi:transcriptional regulator GlxA family with amidase domain